MNINEETLSHCLITLAHVVKEHGDDYLPIFERIKNELDDYRHSQSLKDIALNIAENHPKETVSCDNKHEPSF